MFVCSTKWSLKVELKYLVRKQIELIKNLQGNIIAHDRLAPYLFNKICIYTDQ